MIHLIGHAVWTGTQPNGHGSPSFELGGISSSSAIGVSGNTNSNWVSDNFLEQGYPLGDLYGISQVLTVAGAVPEPSSLMMVGTAIIAGSAFGFSRRRGNQRRERSMREPDATE
jgi:hypothetical protein